MPEGIDVAVVRRGGIMAEAMTGYLMAATAVRSVTRRLDKGLGTEARLSLARTAKLLIDGGENDSSSPLLPEIPADLSPIVEHTEWGDARRLMPPAAVAGATIQWERPARKLGSSEPTW